MQPSTTTIFGLPRGLCSAPTSRSPISGAPRSKNAIRWRRARYRKKQLSLAFETSLDPEIMQAHQWTATAARPALPIYARSLRYSDSDYYVIRMADMAYQTPPGYHQCTFGGSRTPHACAKRLRPRPTTKISPTELNKWQFK